MRGLESAIRSSKQCVFYVEQHKNLVIFFFASVQWLTNFKLTQASFPFSNKKLFAIVLLVV